MRVHFWGHLQDTPPVHPAGLNEHLLITMAQRINRARPITHASISSYKGLSSYVLIAGFRCRLICPSSQAMIKSRSSRPCLCRPCSYDRKPRLYVLFNGRYCSKNSSFFLIVCASFREREC